MPKLNINFDVPENVVKTTTMDIGEFTNTDPFTKQFGSKIALVLVLFRFLYLNFIVPANVRHEKRCKPANLVHGPF